MLKNVIQKIHFACNFSHLLCLWGGDIKIIGIDCLCKKYSIFVFSIYEASFPCLTIFLTHTSPRGHIARYETLLVAHLYHQQHHGPRCKPGHSLLQPHTAKLNSLGRVRTTYSYALPHVLGNAVLQYPVHYSCQCLDAWTWTRVSYLRSPRTHLACGDEILPESGPR